MSNQNPALTEAVYYILLSLTEPLHGYGIMQKVEQLSGCLLYTSPSPRDRQKSRMPSSA